MHKEATIETGRLSLRPIRVEDMDWIRVLADNYEVAKNLGSMPHPYDDEAAADFTGKIRAFETSGEDYVYAIVSEQPMGLIGMHDQGDDGWETGFWIGEPFWNQGYVTEALSALTRFAFETIGVNRLWAGHLIDNPASRQVQLKCGFRDTGHIVEHECLARGVDIPCRIMEYRRSDWLRDQETDR